MVWKRLQKTPTRKSAAPARFRPKVEGLEGRWLPSTVTNLADSGPGSLRQAILDTPAGGTVDFQAGLMGTITLMTGVLDINKDLTIQGPGASIISVNGNNASTVFRVDSGDTVTISELTITNGNAQAAEYGGGILNAGSLTVDDSVVSGNSANYGGGIYSSGPLTIQNQSLITNNNAIYNISYPNSGDGAGINIASGTLTINSSTLTRNTAGANGGGVYDRSPSTWTTSDSTFQEDSASGYGGAIWTSGNTVTISNTTLYDNAGGPLSTTGAGAIYCAQSASVEIDQSNLTYNVGGSGGAIIVDGSTTTIRNSTLSNNNASLRLGGAIWNGANSHQGSVTIENTTLDSNSAAQGGAIFNSLGSVSIASSTLSDNTANAEAFIGSTGGAIHNLSGLTVSNSTFSGNKATGDGRGDGGEGGAIFNVGSLTSASCTFSNNSALDGPQSSGQGGAVDVEPTYSFSSVNTIIAGDTATSGPDLWGTMQSQGHNLIGDSSGGGGFVATDILNVSAQLGPLQDNGGPTYTQLPMGSSPAVDAGDNSHSPGDYDQRGYTRIVNGTIDIGSVELQTCDPNCPGGFTRSARSTVAAISVLADRFNYLAHGLSTSGASCVAGKTVQVIRTVRSVAECERRSAAAEQGSAASRPDQSRIDAFFRLLTSNARYGPEDFGNFDLLLLGF